MQQYLAGLAGIEDIVEVFQKKLTSQASFLQCYF